PERSPGQPHHTPDPEALQSPHRAGAEDVPTRPRPWSEAGPEPTPVPGAVRPQWSDHSDSTRHQPAQPASQAQAPSSSIEVHIAIGQIEVRTVPRAEDPRRPALQPRVTIEEYLRLRNGDAR